MGILGLFDRRDQTRVKKMKFNFQLCLLCICAAVAVVECQEFGNDEFEEVVGWFDALKMDGDDVLTFEEMYGQSREQMTGADPELASRATSEFDGMDIDANGEIMLDEFLTYIEARWVQILQNGGGLAFM